MWNRSRRHFTWTDCLLIWCKWARSIAMVTTRTGNWIHLSFKWNVWMASPENMFRIKTGRDRANMGRQRNQLHNQLHVYVDKNYVTVTLHIYSVDVGSNRFLYISHSARHQFMRKTENLLFMQWLKSLPDRLQRGIFHFNAKLVLGRVSATASTLFVSIHTDSYRVCGNHFSLIIANSVSQTESHV